MANIIRRIAEHGSQTVWASAARTAAPDTQEFEFVGAANVSSAWFIVDVTVDPATASITLNIDGVDRLSGKTWTLLDSAAINSVGTTTYQIGPGVTGAANTTADDHLPTVIRLSMAHADTDSITYSVGAHFMP